MEELKIQNIKTSLLNKAEWNYKEEDAEMADKLTENIKRNGILQVSVLYEEEDGRLVVLDGNHRLDSYYRLNIQEVPCVNLGKITLAEAKRISVELNETKFENDVFKLAQTIKDIGEEFSIDDMVKTLGFSKDELESLATIDEVDFEELNEEELNEDEPLDEERPGDQEVKCPNCGKSFPRSEGGQES